ncbi:2-dehydro-3-deoxy-6-phosphogalactonate aldolase [Dyella sp. C11]|uniref:2-dehydro-3-deoxy-6-phosphogalactonate aldolase n=1 Tax=Dyella sp. C11 TaxID=2126991 RepID=UPI000D6462D8|nr:2-dehydro-3-deoxy-6-phosphogalactonate aldolase [Dyella sp. C11]
MNALAMNRVKNALESMPIVAILRGIRSDEAIPVVEALYEAGIRIAEVPLNSPDPFDTIDRLVKHFGSRMVIGAGTVVDPADVPPLAFIGCEVCVAPNADQRVIETTIAHGMVPMPGVATATEAFAAVAAGASVLKVFPAADSAPKLSAWRTVLPRNVKLLAVGGVQPEAAEALRAAGADGFGLGSDIYRPGYSPEQVRERARAWVAVIRCAAQDRAQLLTQANARVGESVRMDGHDVIWLDPPHSRLLRWQTHNEVLHEQHLSQPVWSLGHTTDSGWVGATENALCRIDVTSGDLSCGPMAPLAPGCRFNDMTVDDDGGLWVGSMHRGLLSSKGGIFHSSGVDMPVQQMAEGLGVANGMAFSADGNTLYVVDTLARVLLAYPRDRRGPRLGEPVVVSDFMAIPGKPDGLALAADGTLWVAMWGGGCVVQLGSDGAFLRAIAVPAPHVGSVCFDADGHVFVSTSQARLSAEALAKWPGSGGLFRITAPA